MPIILRIIIKPIYIIAMLLVLFGCQRQITINGSGDVSTFKKSSSVVVQFERQPCFGTCPVYKASFYDNGMVLYEGKRYTEYVGTYYAIADRTVIEDLIETAVSFGFFNMAASYPEFEFIPGDLPAQLIMIENKGLSKTVINNNSGQPPELMKLEGLIDKAIKELTLVKYDNNITD